MAEAGPVPSTQKVGQRLVELIAELYPICRSITGDGVRETLRAIASRIPIEIREVPSGTAALDWTVPPEWNIREAWIADASGRRVVDFARHNLHVVSYSEPVRAKLPLSELRAHLHTLPEHPEWIPYRTSYYARSWGFCLSQRQLDALEDGEYEVCIDATLAPGHLSYGELYLPGETADEILVSAHVCHPSLCNDNLSGIAVSVELARQLADQPRRYSLRFLYAPGTIGSLVWLSRNAETLKRVRHGFTLVCVGDDAPLTWKRTFAGDAEIDRAAEHLFDQRAAGDQVIDFHPWGYDERQYNAPGFRLPVGSLMRGRHGEFPEYHTSADDLDFVSAAQLEDALDTCRTLVDVLDRDRRYRNLQPLGEPQLGKRGIYRTLGGDPDSGALQLAMLWVLTGSDGEHSLLDIARRSGLPFERLARAADLLLAHDLVEAID